MKYDRPVWQLMHACADALPDTFRYTDVRTWFAVNFPEVGEATVRAHVVGLTEGGAKHPQFERRSPLFRRVARGVYAPIPLQDRGELPVDGPDDGESASVRFSPMDPRDGDWDDLDDIDRGQVTDAALGPDLLSAEEFWPFPPDPRATRAVVPPAVSERDRLESERAEREATERQQLEAEEQQLHLTLRPMLDDADRPPNQPSTTDEPFTSTGGIVIVRAPRSTAGAGAWPVQIEPVQIEGVQIEGVQIEPRASDAIVLGSVGERLRVPAPAREAFRDLRFQRARRDAELSGARWFVLSTEHGLLEPQEWMSPDERSMTDIDPRQRSAWATWVVARLETLVGGLSGQLVQVEAPDVIAAPVLAALREAGADTTTGPIPEANDVGPDPVDDPAGDPVDDPAGDPVDAQVLPFLRGASIAARSVAEHLADPRHVMSAAAAAGLPHHPGLYAWTVDHAGSRELNRALRLPVRAGLIFVGQVGGSTGLSDSGFSLNHHVTRVQLHGRTRSSTFRMTLATALAGFLGLHSIEDPRLTQWMLDHLSVSTWPTTEVANLHQLSDSVVDELRPVLNVDRERTSEYRDRIAELRGRLA